jgi:hypothetical protein
MNLKSSPPNLTQNEIAEKTFFEKTQRRFLRNSRENYTRQKAGIKTISTNHLPPSSTDPHGPLTQQKDDPNHQGDAASCQIAEALNPPNTHELQARTVTAAIENYSQQSNTSVTSIYPTHTASIGKHTTQARRERIY